MIAVTGANGLLGSYIVRKLVAMKMPVTAIVRKESVLEELTDLREHITIKEADVMDVPALLLALEGASAVIHTAAMVSFNPRKAKKILNVNVEGTRNVVDACLSLGIPQLIHVSSVAALGRQKGGGKIDEESKWADSPLNSDYAESKYLAELEIFRGQEEGLRVAMVSPSVILAPTDWRKTSAQLFKYVWNQNIFYTRGTINYVDVRDVAELVVIILQRDFSGEKFIANAGAVTLKDFFQAIAQRFGRRAPWLLAKSPWINIIARLEEIRCFLTGGEPVATRQSVRMAREPFLFSSEKSTKILGLKFRSMEESLDWCCAEYLRKININK